MARTSGSPDSLTIMVKETGASRSFPCKSDDEITLDLGGFSNENSMNGNGTGHIKKTRKGWMIESVNIELSDGAEEFLQGAANSLDDCIFTIVFVNGVAYKGTGQITGDVKHNEGSGYTALTMSGPGSLDKLS